VYSAVGLLGADFRVDLSRGVRIALASNNAGEELSQMFSMLQSRATDEMQSQGHAMNAIEVRYSADVRYKGQSYEVNVGLPAAVPVDSQHAQTAFHLEHARLYGHASDGEPVEVITARVSASVAGERPRLAGNEPEITTPQHRTRNLSFDGDVQPTPVHSRHEMAATVTGPAAIEQSDTTVIVPPSAQVQLLANGCLQMQLPSQRQGSST
jgi:N-methylhydantoinase A